MGAQGLSKVGGLGPQVKQGKLRSPAGSTPGNVINTKSDPIHFLPFLSCDPGELILLQQSLGSGPHFLSSLFHYKTYCTSVAFPTFMSPSVISLGL